MGLLVDRSDSDDGPQTHPRFLACKAHNRNTDAVKAMKEMYTNISLFGNISFRHSKFVKQENARLKQIKKDDPQVATDLDNMKVKLDEVLQKLQGVSITKPDIHCNSVGHVVYFSKFSSGYSSTLRSSCSYLCPPLG